MELKKYLDQRSITMSEFARICGVNRCIVTRICNGTRLNPSVKTAYRFILGSNGKLKITDFIQDKEIQKIQQSIDV